MKTKCLTNFALFVFSCAMVFGVAVTAPALAANDPFTLVNSPVLTPTPLLTTADSMSADPLNLVADVTAKGGSQVEVEDDLRFRLSLPLWLPGLSGDITVRGRELSGGSGDGDFLDTLDCAAVLHFEAEKGQWGAFVDAMYVSFTDDKDLRTGGVAEATVEGFIGELGAFYTLFPPKPGVKGWGMFRADILAGVRLSVVELGVKTNAFDDSRDLTIIDPIVGARMELGLTDWLSFKLRGDIGGFGIDPGTTSNFVWNVETGLEFHLAKWFDVGVGYRWFDDDFENGSSEFDLLLSGPVITIQFRF